MAGETPPRGFLENKDQMWKQVFAALTLTTGFLAELDTIIKAESIIPKARDNAGNAVITAISNAANDMLAHAGPDELKNLDLTTYNVLLDSLRTGTIRNVSPIDFPEFNETLVTADIEAPISSFPTAPSINTNVESVVLPTAPVVNVNSVAVPVLNAVVLPNPPAINLPVWTGVSPAGNVVALVNNFVFNEIAFPDTSTLLSSIKTVFLDAVLNGGTGIHPTDAAIIFQARKDQAIKNGDAARLEMERVFISTGFVIPNGVTLSIQALAARKMRDEVASASREVLNVVTDITQKARQFDLATATDLEKHEMSIWDSRMNRALSAAKTAMDISVAIYLAQIDKYKADWVGYQTEAEVFKTQIEGQMAIVSVYSAQVQAAGVAASTNKILIELYTAQLDAVMKAVEIYKAEMEGAQIHANIINLQLQGQKMLIDIYTQEVGAKSAEYELYKTRWSAEGIKADVFGKKVGAYTAVVGAKVSKVQADAIGAESDAKVIAAQIEAYKVQLSAKEMEIGRKIKVAETLIKQHDSNVGAWHETAQNMSNATGHIASSGQINADLIKAVWQADIGYYQAWANFNAAFNATKAQTVGHGTSVYEQLVSAALMAVQTIEAQITTKLAPTKT